MKTIKLQEIIECSSQQSILTGQAGFGIRTFTEGMDEKLARTICEQVNCAYEVDITHQVSIEEITHNAHVTQKYPRTLRYTAIKDDDDKLKYIVACSTYIGIDYGYFCQQESAQRAGTNYIADILVFDEQPTAKLINALLTQKIFLPIDNTCSPNNPELQALLTGKPSFLMTREITYDDVCPKTPFINEQTAFVAIALIQANSNRVKGKEKGLQNIVIQAEERKVSSILRDLSILPVELTDKLFFQTNYLQGYGMPRGYHMIFLNEYNKEEVYTDNYVYVDLDKKVFKNVDINNPCFLQMTETAKENDYSLFHALIEICLHKDLTCLTKLLKVTPCNPHTLQAMHAVLESYFTGQMESCVGKGIRSLYAFAKEVGEETFGALNLNSLINEYATYCFQHPKKSDIECATYFLCGKNLLEEDAEAYLEIICRLHKNAQNINGTFWELLIAKRMGLPIINVRMKIFERLLQYQLEEHEDVDYKMLQDYIVDVYSENSTEEQKYESMQMLNSIWKVFESREDICQKSTITIIETAKWSKQDMKDYISQCDHEKTIAFIKKRYGFWSSLSRKLFNK